MPIVVDTMTRPAPPTPNAPSPARPSESGAVTDGMPLSLRQAVSIMQTNDAGAAASQLRTQAGAQASRHVAGRPVKVQIVEDLPRVQQLLRSLVEQPGRFEVTGIDDSEQAALERCNQDPPDVIIVDLNLREGSGLGVIHAVKRMAGASLGPLVMVVTNHTMPVLQAACMKAGAHHFLDKSRELPKLRQVLDDTFYA